MAVRGERRETDKPNRDREQIFVFVGIPAHTNKREHTNVKGATHSSKQTTHTFAKVHRIHRHTDTSIGSALKSNSNQQCVLSTL